tara:strand:- start:664 stop:951 length:288 start_codon:yes stop_codon:yes gene_type:complete
MHLNSPVLAVLLLTAADLTSSRLLSQIPANASLAAAERQLDGKLPNNIPSDFHFSGNVRTYYIQAEQVTWDYVPTGWDNVSSPMNSLHDEPRDRY